MTDPPEPEPEDPAPDYLAGSLTPMHPVSEKQAAKNLKRRNPVGFR